MMHKKDMKRTAPKCEHCHAQPATIAMFPEDGSKNNKPVMMCEDCAFAAFESGAYQSDLNK